MKYENGNVTMSMNEFFGIVWEIGPDIVSALSSGAAGWSDMTLFILFEGWDEHNEFTQEFAARLFLRFGQPEFKSDFDPEMVEVVNEDGEQLEIVMGFTDEYNTCGECGKVIRTQPDSYSWVPEYSYADGEIVCEKCVLGGHPSEYLERVMNNPRSPLTLDIDPEEYGFVLVDEKFSNGLHPGMDDDPKALTVALANAGFDVIWGYSPSQFYVDFYPYVRMREAGKTMPVEKGVVESDVAAQWQQAVLQAMRTVVKR